MILELVVFVSTRAYVNCAKNRRFKEEDDGLPGMRRMEG
jgi:hypothetical protein